MQTKLSQAAPLSHRYTSPLSVAVRMAQFILESKAGESDLFRKSYNGFGIKASPPWQGPTILHESWEADGRKHKAYFRKYPNLEASIQDHASFFTSTPYRAQIAYRPAIEAKTYQAEAQALAGVYAGDPHYGNKLIDLIEAYQLTQYDQETTPQWQPVLIDRRDQALGGQAKDRRLIDITTIVWHYTAVARRLRRKIWDHERYWHNDRDWDRGGYHYYIDSDGILYQNYDLERITWGVADHNQDTVHISVEAGSKADYSAEQIRTRDWITRQLMAQLTLPAHQVKGHWEVNPNTQCPGYSQAEMDHFRQLLAQPLRSAPLVEDHDLVLDGKKYQVHPV